MLSTAGRAAVSQTEGQRFEKSALKLFNLELTFEVQTLVVGDKKHSLIGIWLVEWQ